MKTWLLIYCYLSRNSTLYAIFYAGSLYRQDNFIKMLAPIRHYVRDSLPPPDITSLQDLRDFYNRTVEQCSEEQDRHADIIVSDHLNTEHVVAFIFAHVPDGTDKIYDICWAVFVVLA
jgi:hypothetical protein